MSTDAPPPAPSSEALGKTDAEPQPTETAPKKRKPKSSEPKQKRGPARPHRRLATDVIDTRIAKLQKRLDRAKAQIEDATRHVEGYQRERQFRAQEADPAK